MKASTKEVVKDLVAEKKNRDPSWAAKLPLSPNADGRYPTCDDAAVDRILADADARDLVLLELRKKTAYLGEALGLLRAGKQYDVPERLRYQIYYEALNDFTHT